MIASETELEDLLSCPNEQDVEALRGVEGDILILGAGGKMGPSLARRAQRANKRVIAVARRSVPGIETIEADLLKSDAIQRLPDAANVIYMAARKFGTSGDEAGTWATNAYLPGLVADRFRHSRIVTWSTGNVYPLSLIASRGPNENSPTGPIGEYAQSALARERVFEYFDVKLAILRLNYAVELRYGVLVDIGRAVYERRAVDLTMGAVNIIWQGDANSICLRALAHCSSPPFLLNVTSAEAYRVRWIAERFGEQFGIEPVFSGRESDTALLSDATKCHQLFGPPSVSVEQAIEWAAHWIREGGVIWNKPTHFAVRDGKF